MAKEEKEIKEETESTEASAEKPEEAVKTEKAKDEETVDLSKNAQEILGKIETMTVLELNALVKALETKFGVSAQAPMAFAATPANGGSGDAEETEEQTSFDVILANMGENKLAVIKAVRELKPDLGLKDAKDLVESAPKPILEGAKKEDAEAAKTKLEEAGGKVELK